MLADAMNRVEQLCERVKGAYEQPSEPFYVVPARTAARLSHRPALLACPPGDLPPGWCRGGDPARARVGHFRQRLRDRLKPNIAGKHNLNGPLWVQ